MLSLKYLTTTVLSAGLLVLPIFSLPSGLTKLSPLFLAQAQSISPEAETAIDQAFRSGSLPPGTSTQLQSLVNGIRLWMGSYQGLRREGDGYLVTFERGELPVSVRQDAKGQINSVSIGCPRSNSLNLNQASQELRQVLSSCPGLQN
jgi:hypothetical protein